MLRFFIVGILHPSNFLSIQKRPKTKIRIGALCLYMRQSQFYFLFNENIFNQSPYIVIKHHLNIYLFYGRGTNEDVGNLFLEAVRMN